MTKSQRFIQREEMPEYGRDWREKTHVQEYGPGKIYKMDRVEGHQSTPTHDSIDNIHGRSFIRELIPEKIATLKGKRKVKILIVGDGTAAFSEQIRHTFGNKVDVSSTGLSKKLVKDIRKDTGENVGFAIGNNKMHISNKVHQNDLKWRSILQLSTFPEFDFIIDTIGEYYYAHLTREEYLKAIAAKLLPGGMASIYPAQCPKKEDMGNGDSGIELKGSQKATDKKKMELHQRALDQDGIKWTIESNKSTKEPGGVLTITKD